MYREFFALRELPFRESPDPRLLVATERFQRAAAVLTRAIADRRELLTLIGAAGTGKTLLLRHLPGQYEGTSLRVGTLPHPELTPQEFVGYLVRWLGPSAEPADSDSLRALTQTLRSEHAAGRHGLLIIDEAQALPAETLKALPALLTSARHGEQPQLQVLLTGQASLTDRLREAGISIHRDARAELAPLGRDEVKTYLRARLRSAGASDPWLFSTSAAARIARYSLGIPRMINVIADGCLLQAFREGERRITPDLVKRFWSEYGRTREGTWPPVPAGHLSLPETSVAAPTAAKRAPAPTIPEGMAPRADARRPTPQPAAPRGELLAAPTQYVAPQVRVRHRWRAVSVLVLLMAGLGGLLARPWFHRATGVTAPTLPAPGGDLATVTARDASGNATRSGPSPAEVLGVIDEFRKACEARDSARVRRTLAATVQVGEEMRDADEVAAAFERVFVGLLSLNFVQPSAQFSPSGGRTRVETSFEVRYRDRHGLPGWSFGTVIWEVGRRNGTVRITALDLDPNDLLTPHVRSPKPAT